jgi:hypothetical protein
MHKSILLPALLAVSSYINLAHSQPEILVSVIDMSTPIINFHWIDFLGVKNSRLWANYPPPTYPPYYSYPLR